MATGKRYYWIKLKDSFMTSDTVDFLMSQPDGANYVVLYQMLCLKTINTGGRLSRKIGEMIIPFNKEKIQRDCKWFSIDTIMIALGLFKRLGLIYEEKDGTLVMTDHDNLVGSETDYAEKNRRIREKQKLLAESGHNVSSDVSENVTIDNRDKILDTRDKNIDTTKPKDTTTSTMGEEVEEFDDLYSDDWKRVVSVYRKDIGSLPTGTALETFSSYIEDLGADAVIVAIKKTNDAQPDRPWKYLKCILDEFADKNVHSEDEANAVCNDHERMMKIRAKEREKAKAKDSARFNDGSEAIFLE